MRVSSCCSFTTHIFLAGRLFWRRERKTNMGPRDAISRAYNFKNVNILRRSWWMSTWAYGKRARYRRARCRWSLAGHGLALRDGRVDETREHQPSRESCCSCEGSLNGQQRGTDINETLPRYAPYKQSLAQSVFSAAPTSEEKWLEECARVKGNDDSLRRTLFLSFSTLLCSIPASYIRRPLLPRVSRPICRGNLL